MKNWLFAVALLIGLPAKAETPALVPNNINFGFAGPGTTASAVITVELGTQPVAAGQFRDSITAPFTIQNDAGCKGAMGAGTWCHVYLSFTPNNSTPAGTISGTYNVVFPGTNGLTATLIGSCPNCGAPAPLASSPPPTVNSLLYGCTVSEANNTTPCHAPAGWTIKAVEGFGNGRLHLASDMSQQISTAKPHTGSFALGGLYSGDGNVIADYIKQPAYGNYHDIYVSYWDWEDANALIPQELYILGIANCDQITCP